MRRYHLAALALLVTGTAAPTRLVAQGVEYVRANYTKYEYRIPMRDGVKLFTSVYVPKDTSKTYPILLMRTPYSVGPYGLARFKGDLGPSPAFGTAGYIFAYQDVRGRWMSEGEFVNMRPHRERHDGPTEIDESTDTFDTIDWLVKHVVGNNGKVGQYGISYPGFYTDCGILSGHPALVAASPQAPVTDWFVGDDFHHNGALFLPHLFNFIANFGKPRPKPTTKSEYLPFEHGTPDGYAFFLDMGPLPNADTRYFKGEVAFWNEVMEHPNYDAFWQSRDIRRHLQEIKPAVLTVGGWFDAENVFGALETYKAIEKTSPGATNTLVMGPWFHGGWSRGDGEKLGHVAFDSKTSEFYRDQIEFPFFERHLKGDAGRPEMPEAFVFETGRNQWHRHDAWPPRGTEERSLHLRENGRLGFDAPREDDPYAYDEYMSDPAKPVPFIDNTDIGMTIEYMVGDQRFAGRRPDVLVYQTGPLEEDLTLAGPIRAELFVATTGTDSDWVVKLIDVYPDDYPDPEPNPAGVRMGGFQQMVRGDVMRGRFRDSYEEPAPFEPGKPTAVRMNLNDVYHTFRTGHRIMVQVQSTWFPLVDRNPQKFVDIYKARASDFEKATQRVYHSKGMPSRLVIGVLPAGKPDVRSP
jgi:putative CocE/NonD family hydrolase